MTAEHLIKHNSCVDTEYFSISLSHSLTCLCLCLLTQMEIYSCRVFASIAFTIRHYNMWFERFLQLSGNIYKCVVSFAKVASFFFVVVKTINNSVNLLLENFYPVALLKRIRKKLALVIMLYTSYPFVIIQNGLCSN